MTLYEPLCTFCGPLHTAFPDLTPGFDRLLECRASRTWDVISTIGPGCTKALLVACLQKDDESFFRDSETNPFLSFLGGKVLYDRLLAVEKDAYWGDSHLANIIRQCMVLHALEPMTTKLECIVSKITSSSTSQQLDKSNIVKTLLSDPTLMSSMLGLMDSPESMQTLLSSLRTIVEGMLTEATADKGDEEGEEEDEEGGKTAACDVEVEAMVSPGTFLKREKTKKKNRKKNKNGSGRNQAPGVHSLLAMMDDMKLDEKDLKEMSDDIQSMKAEDYSTIASAVSNMMSGEGGGMQQMMQTLAAGSGGTGMDGMQQMMQTLCAGKSGGIGDMLQALGTGKGGMDGIKQMLQTLGGSAPSF